MPTEFLVPYSLLLAVRAVWIHRRKPVSRRYAYVVIALTALIGLTLRIRTDVIILMALLLVFGVAERLSETRAGMKHPTAKRLVLLLLQTLALLWVFRDGQHVVMAGWARAVGESAWRWFMPLQAVRVLGISAVWTLITGMLLVLSESNLVVRGVLNLVRVWPTVSGRSDEDDIGEENGSNEADRSMYSDQSASGAVIGALERALVALLILNGHFGAVGFVIAAKGLARFKKLEDKCFAEYFLVGTLLSVSCAIIVSMLMMRSLSLSS